MLTHYMERTFLVIKEQAVKVIKKPKPFIHTEIYVQIRRAETIHYMEITEKMSHHKKED